MDPVLAKFLDPLLDKFLEPVLATGVGATATTGAGTGTGTDVETAKTAGLAGFDLLCFLGFITFVILAFFGASVFGTAFLVLEILRRRSALIT